MKYAIFTLIALSGYLLFSFTPVQRPEFIMNNFRSAQDKAEQENKLLIVHFTARWCAPCQVMEENTWPNPDLVAFLAENCVAAKMDIENFDAMGYAQQFKVKNVPTLLVFSADGRALGRYENSISASHLIKYLSQFNTPEHKLGNKAAMVTNHEAELQPQATYDPERGADEPTNYQSTTIDTRNLVEPILEDFDDWKNGEMAMIPEKTKPEANEPIRCVMASVIALRTEMKALPAQEAEIVTVEPTTYTFHSSIIHPKPDRKMVGANAEKPGKEIFQEQPSDFLYTLQIGAFKSKASAQKVMKATADATGSFSLVIEPEELHDAYFRVVTGSFINREAAQKHLQKIKIKGIDGFVRILPEQAATYLSMGMR